MNLLMTLAEDVSKTTSGHFSVIYSVDEEDCFAFADGFADEGFDVFFVNWNDFDGRQFRRMFHAREGRCALPIPVDEFDVIFLPWIIERTKLEYLQMARRAGLLSGALFTVEDLLQDPHYQARDFFPEVDHPVTGPVRYPGPLVKMPASPAGVRAPAPLLGQHNEEVYQGRLGFTKADLVRMRRMGVI